MATVKRTTTVRTPARTLPALPQDEPRGVGDRWPQAPEAPDEHYPDEPEPEQQPANVVVTVGEEQLQRSREMQEMGIANWVAAHDERDPADQPRAIEGVTPLER